MTSEEAQARIIARQWAGNAHMAHVRGADDLPICGKFIAKGRRMAEPETFHLVPAEKRCSRCAAKLAARAGEAACLKSGIAPN